MGSHHVFRMVLVTVDEVYLATAIAGPDLGIWDQGTVVVDQVIVDKDLATGNLGPVIDNGRLPVAFGIHDCLDPWVGIGDYPDPESSSKQRRISPPTGQVTESWNPGEFDPAAGD